MIKSFKEQVCTVPDCGIGPLSPTGGLGSPCSAHRNQRVQITPSGLDRAETGGAVPGSHGSTINGESLQVTPPRTRKARVFRVDVPNNNKESHLLRSTLVRTHSDTSDLKNYIRHYCRHVAEEVVDIEDLVQPQLDRKVYQEQTDDTEVHIHRARYKRHSKNDPLHKRRSLKDRGNRNKGFDSTLGYPGEGPEHKCIAGHSFNCRVQKVETWGGTHRMCVCHKITDISSHTVYYCCPPCLANPGRAIGNQPPQKQFDSTKGYPGEGPGVIRQQDMKVFKHIINLSFKNEDAEELSICCSMELNCPVPGHYHYRRPNKKPGPKSDNKKKHPAKVRIDRKAQLCHEHVCGTRCTQNHLHTREQHEKDWGDRVAWDITAESENLGDSSESSAPFGVAPVSAETDDKSTGSYKWLPVTKQSAPIATEEKGMDTWPQVQLPQPEKDEEKTELQILGYPKYHELCTKLYWMLTAKKENAGLLTGMAMEGGYVQGIVEGTYGLEEFILAAKLVIFNNETQTAATPAPPVEPVAPVSPVVPEPKPPAPRVKTFKWRCKIDNCTLVIRRPRIEIPKERPQLRNVTMAARNLYFPRCILQEKIKLRHVTPKARQTHYPGFYDAIEPGFYNGKEDSVVLTDFDKIEPRTIFMASFTIDHPEGLFDSILKWIFPVEEVHFKNKQRRTEVNEAPRVYRSTESRAKLWSWMTGDTETMYLTGGRKKIVKRDVLHNVLVDAGLGGSSTSPVYVKMASVILRHPSLAKHKPITVDGKFREIFVHYVTDLISKYKLMFTDLNRRPDVLLNTVMFICNQAVAQRIKVLGVCPTIEPKPLNEKDRISPLTQRFEGQK